jgi:hypothetical protein
MWMFNFWCFPKDDCFILALFKWLEKKKNGHPQKVFVFRPYPIS